MTALPQSFIYVPVVVARDRVIVAAATTVTAVDPRGSHNDGSGGSEHRGGSRIGDTADDESAGDCLAWIDSHLLWVAPLAMS